MADGIDVQLNVLGAKELERTFRILERKVGRKIMREVMRKSAKRLKPEVVKRAPRDTGEYVNALRRMKVRSAGGGRGVIRLGLAFPTREELGISANDPYFYPAALEYGHAPPGLGVAKIGRDFLAKRKRKRAGKIGARPHFRPAVDENQSREFRLIGDDIRRAIDRELGVKAGT